MKFLLVTLILMVVLACSNASCEQISLQPIQTKDIVLETTIYKLGYGGYTASMVEVWDDLREVMKMWKMKDTKKIRYNIYLNIYATKWSDDIPNQNSYFVIRFFRIK